MDSLLPPTVHKEWHQQVTNDLRMHLLGKVVKNVFPNLTPEALNHPLTWDFIAYARKVERAFLDMADDREEYYHLLAEKVYKIQKKLTENNADRFDAIQQVIDGDQ